MKCKKIMAICCSALLLSVSLTGCGSAASVSGSAELPNQGSGAEVQAEGSGQLEGMPQTEEPVKEEEPVNPMPKGEKYMAITFDDGPTGNEGGRTERLLDGLKERNVHATFFVCGYRVKDFHSMMNRYLTEGHEVGNHTMDHIRLDTQTDDGGYQQISSNNDYVAAYTGQKPTVMRPVGGAYNNAVQEAMAELGMPIINWDIDTLDWKYRDAESVKQRIIDQAHDGAIVLEHDLYETTVEGVLAAIDVLQQEGYAFVTVSELAEQKGVALEPGKVYECFGEHPEEDTAEDTEENMAEDTAE